MKAITFSLVHYSYSYCFFYFWLRISIVLAVETSNHSFLAYLYVYKIRDIVCYKQILFAIHASSYFFFMKAITFSLVGYSDSYFSSSFWLEF